MAPVECKDDLYAVLQVSFGATTAEIRRSYYRLAKLYHPDKNQAPTAKAQFQQLSRAYETLSDEALRRQYDLTWTVTRNAQHANPSPGTGNGPNTTSTQHSAPPNASKSTAEAAAPSQQRLDILKRKNYQADICSARSRTVDRIQAEITSLTAENMKEAASQETSIWTWFGLGSGGTTQEKQKREAARLQRGAAIRIKSSQLAEARKEAERQQEILRDIESELAAEERKEEARKRQSREEEIRQQREKEREKERKKAEAVDEFLRRMREAQAREHEEVRARDEAARQQEAEWMAKWREERQARVRKAREEKARSSNGPKSSRFAQTSGQECRHQGWWSRVEGRHTCKNCQAVQYRFILKCLQCEVTACAKCRPVLQGKSRKDWRDFENDDHHGSWDDL